LFWPIKSFLFPKQQKVRDKLSDPRFIFIDFATVHLFFRHCCLSGEERREEEEVIWLSVLR
jgi:hypothetical protein